MSKHAAHITKRTTHEGHAEHKPYTAVLCIRGGHVMSPYAEPQALRMMDYMRNEVGSDKVGYPPQEEPKSFFPANEGKASSANGDGQAQKHEWPVTLAFTNQNPYNPEQAGLYAVITTHDRRALTEKVKATVNKLEENWRVERVKGRGELSM